MRIELLDSCDIWRSLNNLVHPFDGTDHPVPLFLCNEHDFGSSNSNKPTYLVEYGRAFIHCNFCISVDTYDQVVTHGFCLSEGVCVTIMNHVITAITPNPNLNIGKYIISC